MDQGELCYVCCPQKRYLFSTDFYFFMSKRIRKCRKELRGEPYTSTALRGHVKEQTSNPTRALSVDKQIDVEHDMQSDPIFCHDVYSIATQSPQVYLWEYAELHLHFNQGEGICLVDELLLMFQRAPPTSFLLSLKC